MAAQGEQEPAGGAVPELDLAGPIGGTAAAGEALAIGAVGDGGGAFDVAGEREAAAGTLLQKVPFPIAQGGARGLEAPFRQQLVGAVVIRPLQCVLHLPHLREVEELP